MAKRGPKRTRTSVRAEENEKAKEIRKDRLDDKVEEEEAMRRNVEKEEEQEEEEKEGKEEKEEEEEEEEEEEGWTLGTYGAQDCGEVLLGMTDRDVVRTLCRAPHLARLAAAAERLAAADGGEGEDAAALAMMGLNARVWARDRAPWAPLLRGGGALAGVVAAAAAHVAAAAAAPPTRSIRRALLLLHAAQFLVHAFAALDVADVRAAALPLVGPALWRHVDPALVDDECSRAGQGLRAQLAAGSKRARALAQKADGSFARALCSAVLAVAAALRSGMAAGATEEEAEKEEEAGGTAGLLEESFVASDAATRGSRVLSAAAVAEMAMWKLLELLADLLAQLPTRRFLHLPLRAELFFERAAREMVLRAPAHGARLLALAHDYFTFPVDLYGGRALDDAAVLVAHSDAVAAMQRTAYVHFPEELRGLAFAAAGTASERDFVRSELIELDDGALVDFARRCFVVGGGFETAAAGVDPALLLEALLRRFERPRTLYERRAMRGAFPTEADLVGAAARAQAAPLLALALPKLGLQYLSEADFLERCFAVARVEASAAARAQIGDAIQILRPRGAAADGVAFGGWARLAVPLARVRVVEKHRPAVGGRHPRTVTAEIEMAFAAPVPADVLQEWARTPPGALLHLVRLRRPVEAAVEGAMAVAVLRGAVMISASTADRTAVARSSGPGVAARFFKVALDPHQYQLDADSGDADVYSAFDFVVRHDPRDAGLRPQLQYLSAVLGERSGNARLPEWASSRFLGYGATDAGSATVHFLAPAVSVAVAAGGAVVEITKDGRVKGAPDSALGEHAGQLLQAARREAALEAAACGALPLLCPEQVLGLAACLPEGRLRVVAGGPSTGKTTVAACAVSQWRALGERTLVLATSVGQLQELFGMLPAAGVPPRYLVVLGGHVADDGGTGGVPFSADQQIDLIEAAAQLDVHFLQSVAQAAGVSWDPFAWDVDIALARVPQLLGPLWLRAYEQCEWVASEQPLAAAAAALSELGSSVEMVTREHVGALWARVCSAEARLQEAQRLALFGSASDKRRVLATVHAQVVGMTAAQLLARAAGDASELPQFDNILVENAGQLLELDVFVALSMCGPVRRLVLMVDELGLAPVTRSDVAEVYCGFGRSTAARLLRADDGGTVTRLSQQHRVHAALGRALAPLYGGAARLRAAADGGDDAPAGLADALQFVNVPRAWSFRGAAGGESETSSHYFQNVVEAEYVVALYMYLRLAGHAAESIALLSPYLGQVHLLLDVLRQRCAPDARLGLPGAVATIDGFACRHADIVLLSLVRTRHAGHAGDVRRVATALGRARRCAVVFGDLAVFSAAAAWSSVLVECGSPALRLSGRGRVGGPEDLWRALNEMHRR